MPNAPLLSICFPTYNRAELLHKCLASFFAELEENKDFVEIIVSDNASTDETPEVIKAFQKMHQFRYFRNEVNIGAERNFEQCLTAAKGKYFWIFGDDDFILPGHLKLIISLLKEYNPTNVYMGSQWFQKESEIKYTKKSSLNFTVYPTAMEFIRKVNFWVTFISGNIINKKLLMENNARLDFTDTNLGQLGWILPTVFLKGKKIVIENKIIACKAENTGGYRLYEVFGINFNKIMDVLINKGADKRIKNIINKELILKFFPAYTIKRDDYLGTNKYFEYLFPLYWKYRVFWTKIVFPSLKNSLYQKLKK